jgi:hypothetical protein
MRLSFKDAKKISPAAILVILIILFVIASVVILFSQNRPKKTPSQRPALQNGKYSTIYHFDNQKPDTSKGSVEVKSEIKGQMVEILSQKNLIDTLSSWKIFGKKYQFGANGNNSENVKKVVFILTDKPQSNALYPQQGDIKDSGVDIYASGDEVDIKVYISASNLANANTFFESQALFLPYYISHPPASGAAGLNQLKLDYAKFIGETNKTQPLFVVYQVGYK